MIRHRTPSLFNLSMVDVLCCALGCVILLWVLNVREAKKRASAAGEAEKQLKITLQLLDSAKKKYKDIKNSYEEEKSENRSLTDLLANHRRQLKASEIEAKKLLAALQDKTKENKSLIDDLKSSGVTILQLKGDLKAKGKKLKLVTLEYEDLKTKLKTNKTLLAKSKTKLESLSSKMKKSGKEVALLQSQLEDSEKLALKLQILLDKLKLDSKSTASKLVLAEKKADKLGSELEKKDLNIAKLTKQISELLKDKKFLEKSLSISGKNLVLANQEITKLEKKNRIIQAAVENRFAGINLTGKRVIFLVDISGSMSMKDLKTTDPDKWPIVTKAIVKIMRSLPNVSHYQVITFSNKIEYPLGNRGSWLIFEPDKSPGHLENSLKRIQPVGGTKMSPAFAEAFLYRQHGLDTIYLISDGLPNDDDNLPEQAEKLEGVERTAYLSNLVRYRLKNIWNQPIEGKVVRINAVGFFFESPEVGAFLWALARENDGSFVGMSRP